MSLLSVNWTKTWVLCVVRPENSIQKTQFSQQSLKSVNRGKTTLLNDLQERLDTAKLKIQLSDKL